MERASDGVANSENPAAAEPEKAERNGVNVRSNYGAVPGAELPVAVYASVFAAFIWVVVAAWIAFANDADADLALGMAVVLTVVFFALPVLIRLTANSHANTTGDGKQDFLASPVETATGTLTGASAWLQIVLIPAALALAATLIGATAVLVH
jgi:hypothetical protein